MAGQECFQVPFQAVYPLLTPVFLLHPCFLGNRGAVANYGRSRATHHPRCELHRQPVNPHSIVFIIKNSISALSLMAMPKGLGPNEGAFPCSKEDHKPFQRVGERAVMHIRGYDIKDARFRRRITTITRQSLYPSTAWPCP